MKIAIIGGGFTGLAAALKLSSYHDVFLYEKEKTLGGLAGTFIEKGWQWNLEKHYHHWFTNDTFAINLIKELGLESKLFFPKTLTSIYFKNKIYPFNTPSHVLSFKPLSFFNRLRTGFVTTYLKVLPEKLAFDLEKITAWEWLPRYFGKKAFEIVWKPLLLGKFGQEAKKVNMVWVWARIKKRTLTLGYLAGGYSTLIEKMRDKIVQNGGRIFLARPFDSQMLKKFNKTIVTTPSSVFVQTFPQLPKDYKDRLLSIKHLHAINLVFISKEKFLKDTYWLNINDRKFPFIGIIQQTNMIDLKYYGGNHVTWIANYLPSNHPYLKMSKEKLFDIYLPYLKKINPSFNPQPTTYNLQLFFGPFAQPIFPVNFSLVKPDFATPLKNVYLANMDMVYPWDRGTNYAIELGYKVADLVMKD